VYENHYQLSYCFTYNTNATAKEVTLLSMYPRAQAGSCNEITTTVVDPIANAPYINVTGAFPVINLKLYTKSHFTGSTFQSHTLAGKLIEVSTYVVVHRVDGWSFLSNNASYQMLSGLPNTYPKTQFKLNSAEIQPSGAQLHRGHTYEHQDP
jgi:hypothetical protein